MMFKILSTIIFLISLAGCTGGCVHVPADAGSADKLQTKEDLRPTEADIIAESCDGIKEWVESTSQHAMASNPGVIMKNRFDRCDAHVEEDGVAGIYFVTTFIYSSEGSIELVGAFAFKEVGNDVKTSYLVFEQKMAESPPEVQRELDEMEPYNKSYEL